MSDTLNQNNESKDYPLITLSFGMSLDGKIATVTGDSKYISSAESRMFVHRLRAEHDAILVGINTVLIDHPQLTSRLEGEKVKNPIKIILDSTLKMSLDEPLLYSTSPNDVIIVTTTHSSQTKKEAFRSLGVRLIELNQATSPLDIKTAMKIVKEWGIHSVLVEGGSSVHFSFLKERLCHHLYVSISPLIIGGDTAKTAVGGKGFDTLKAALPLTFQRIFPLGNDLMIEAVIQSKEENHD